MDDAEILKEELEYYKSEKEKVRRIIGQIGGATSKSQDMLINVIFLVIVAFSFFFEVFRSIFGLEIKGFPPYVSIELAILLVSIKIIWMIHRQSKIDHFQFWVLSSIEYQINQLSKRLITLEQSLDKK